MDKQVIKKKPNIYMKRVAYIQGVTYYAHQSCKRCFGRGYTGIDVLTKAKHPCKCLVPIKHRENLEVTKQLQETIEIIVSQVYLRFIFVLYLLQLEAARQEHRPAL